MSAARKFKIVYAIAEMRDKSNRSGKFAMDAEDHISTIS